MGERAVVARARQEAEGKTLSRLVTEGLLLGAIYVIVHSIRGFFTGERPMLVAGSTAPTVEEIAEDVIVSAPVAVARLPASDAARPAMTRDSPAPGVRENRTDAAGPAPLAADVSQHSSAAVEQVLREMRDKTALAEKEHVTEIAQIQRLQRVLDLARMLCGVTTFIVAGVSVALIYSGSTTVGVAGGALGLLTGGGVYMINQMASETAQRRTQLTAELNRSRRTLEALRATLIITDPVRRDAAVASMVEELRRLAFTGSKAS